jgi:hypothetical protein
MDHNSVLKTSVRWKAAALEALGRAEEEPTG